MVTNNPMVTTIAINMQETHIRNPPPQHWEPPSIHRAMVLRHSLYTERSLAKLLPIAACVKLCHMSVWLLQVWPIHVGFPWFIAIHVGAPQLQMENLAVPISIWPCGLCAFMLCDGLGVWDFAHVSYLCSIVWSTFGNVQLYGACRNIDT